MIKTKLVDQDIQLTFEDGCREFFEAWNSRCNREIRKTLKLKSHLSPKEYLYRIYYYSNLVDRMELNDSSINDPSNKSTNSVLNKGVSSIVLVLSIVLLVQLWIPAKQTQYEFLGLNISSFGFFDFKTFFYYASNKSILFALGLLWFVTCRYWWRWAILSPVLFYLYQFWEIFQPVKDINSTGNLNILPLVFLTVLVVILLWGLIRRISVNRDYREFLKTELNRSLEQLSREETRNYLWQIKVNSPEVL
jgi:hypothetical protein